jgi:hypothetical protein
MEFSFDFWIQICSDVDFYQHRKSYFKWRWNSALIFEFVLMLIFFQMLMYPFSFDIWGPISFRGFLMPHEFHLCWWVFSLEILWPTDHFFIIFQVFFFIRLFVLGQHNDLPLWLLARNERACA